MSAQASPNTAPSTSAPPAIVMRGIQKHFGPVWANRDIDLTVDKASIHGIIGENGAGKSTLMSVLYGFYQADDGTIAIDGKEVKIANSLESVAIGLGGGCCAEFGRNGVDLIGRNRDMGEPGIKRHSGIALGMVGWKAALVTEVEMPARPVGGDVAAFAVNRLRRRAASQYQIEPAALQDGLLRVLLQAREHSMLQCCGIREGMPLGLLGCFFAHDVSG